MSVDGVWQCRRLVIQYCRNGGSSFGVRELPTSQLFVDFAKRNPHLKIDFRPRNGRHPTVTGSYINDTEHVHDLRKLTVTQILDKLEMLRNQSGRHVPRFKKWQRVRSDTPSFQGYWSGIKTEAQKQAYP